MVYLKSYLESSWSIGILNKSIGNFDPNAKIGEIFVADIEFNAYSDPQEKMYNEVFPCIFEPKGKAPIDRRSVCQLVSTIKTERRENVLKYKATEKTHAPLVLKRGFLCTQNTFTFLQRGAGCKVTKVHLYHTFE